MRKIGVLVVCVLSLACTPNRPAQVSDRTVTVASVDPLEIVAGEAANVTVIGTNLDQVASIRVPAGFRVTELKASQDLLTFRLEAPTGSRLAELSLALLTGNNRELVLDKPLVMAVVTSEQEILRKIQAQTETLEGRISQISTEVAAAIRTQLDPLEAKIATQGNRIESFAGEVNVLKQQFTNLNTQVADLQVQQASLVSNITEFRNQLVTQQSRFEQRETALTQALAAHAQFNQEILSDFNLLATALEEARVPGILGFGSRNLLSDELLERIRARRLAIRPPVAFDISISTP